MSYKPVDAAITMVVGPCIDDTDFKSLEEAIVYNAAGMDVSLIVEKTDGTTAVTAITLTTGGTSDWTHKDGGYYEIEVTAAQNAEEGVAYLRGVCTGVLPFESAHYNIVKANVYDSWVKGTDKLQIDVTQCGGSAVAAGAIPNAAADAAGGLPISDAGGLDLDTKLANTHEVTAARMGALTDWINGGRLDLILDIIAADTTTDIPGLIATAQTDLDTITGADGVTLATAQALYAPNTVVPDAAGVAPTAAEMKAEVVAALADIKLDHLINIAVDTDWATTVHLDSVIGHMADVGTAATFDRTQESMEAIRSRGDAAWIAATGFSVPNEYDTVIAALQTDLDNPAQYKATGFSTHSAADVKTAIEAGGSSLAQILADTGELQTDWVNGGRLDLILDAILLDTGTDGVLLAATATSAQLVDDIWDEILTGALHNIVNSAGRRVREIGAYAIESGTAQAATSNSITLAATASADDGVYNRSLVVIVDNTGVGQTRTIMDYNGTTKVAVIDRDWRVTPDATTAYQITADNTPLVVDQGVAQGGTSTTITLRAYASSVNDTYLCNVVAIIAGTGRGQARLVGSYVGATKVVTICGDNWVTTPDTTSIYVMMPYGTTCTSCLGTYALGLINTECDTALTDYAPNTVVPDVAGTAATLHTSTNGKVDALNDISVAGIIAGITDGALDFQEMMRIILAATAGKSSGGGTVTLVFRDAADSKTRITATVDADGNRTAMTLDGA